MPSFRGLEKKSEFSLPATQEKRGIFFLPGHFSSQTLGFSRRSAQELQELENPEEFRDRPWELMMEREHFRLWRRPIPGSALFQYRGDENLRIPKKNPGILRKKTGNFWGKKPGISGKKKPLNFWRVLIQDGNGSFQGFVGFGICWGFGFLGNFGFLGFVDFWGFLDFQEFLKFFFFFFCSLGLWIFGDLLIPRIC